MSKRAERETYVLSVVPLSPDYSARLEELAPAPRTLLDLQGLRRGQAAPLLKALLRLRRPDVVLAAEHEPLHGYQPYLLLLAALFRPHTLRSIDHHHRFRTISPVRVGTAPISIARGWMDGIRAKRQAGREIGPLLNASRIPAAPVRVPRVLYLKTTILIQTTASGSHAHTVGVVNALLRHGLEVDVLSTYLPSSLQEGYSFTPVPVPDPYLWSAVLDCHRLNERAIEWGFASQRGPGLIYTRLALGNYAGVALSRSLGVPLILEYNSSETWSFRHWGSARSASGKVQEEDLNASIEEVNLRHAHLVVTVSEVLREELLARGVEEERIVVYPNGIDPAIFDPARFPPDAQASLRARYGIDPTETVVTFVGTFGLWHGADVLARVIRRLATEDPTWLEQHRVRFLLVGDGQQMPAVRSILGGEETRRWVEFTGLVPQDAAPAYLAASDVLVAPHVGNPDGSRFFGSPTKLFEYMAMGKGIVASDLEQLGDVLGKSVRASALPAGEPGAGERALGVLAQPGDEAELEAGIRFLVEHRDWRERLGANARQEALTRYTWDRHVDAILAGLQRIDKEIDVALRPSIRSL